MSSGAGRTEPSGTPEATRAAEARRRRAEVFGDVLPDTTGDERSGAEEGSNDEWLRRNVPPHHG